MKTSLFILIVLVSYSCKNDCKGVQTVDCAKMDFFKLKVDKSDSTGFNANDYDTVLIVRTSKDFNIHYDTSLYIYNFVSASFNANTNKYYDFTLVEDQQKGIVDILKNYHFKVFIGHSTFLFSDIEITGEYLEGGDCGVPSCFEKERISCHMNNKYILVYDKFNGQFNYQPILLKRK